MAALRPLTVIGLNSGTSLDGVDAAIFRIIPTKRPSSVGNGSSAIQRLEVEMLDSLVYSLERDLVRSLSQMMKSGRAGLDDLCRLNVALGEVFAGAALAVMKKATLTKSEVDLIGSHGQTIWHAPSTRRYAGILTHGTMQIGEPAIIAQRTGIPVVGDFRAADAAAGGQGAPLVAFADEVMFGGQDEPIAVLNIGGIANLTVLDEHGEAVMAFDTGPGNMIIDRVANSLFGKDYDAGGQIAGGGKVQDHWLAELSENDYFRQAPPKTTGRERFGPQFADTLIAQGRQYGYSDVDIIATLTALTARSVASAYRDFVQTECEIKELVLGGGGAENAALLSGLRKYWPHPVRLRRHEEFGIATKFKESLLFALLAYTTHFGIPNNVPRCTGASSKVCLGKICRP